MNPSYDITSIAYWGTSTTSTVFLTLSTWFLTQLAAQKTQPISIEPRPLNIFEPVLPCPLPYALTKFPVCVATFPKTSPTLPKSIFFSESKNPIEFNINIMWDWSKKQKKQERSWAERIQEQQREFDEIVSKKGLNANKNDQLTVYLRKTYSRVSAQQKAFGQSQRKFFLQIDQNNKKVMEKIELFGKELEQNKAQIQTGIRLLNQSASVGIKKTQPEISDIAKKIRSLSESVYKLQELYMVRLSQVKDFQEDLRGNYNDFKKFTAQTNQKFLQSDESHRALNNFVKKNTGGLWKATQDIQETQSEYETKLSSIVRFAQQGRKQNELFQTKIDQMQGKLNNKFKKLRTDIEQNNLNERASQRQLQKSLYDDVVQSNQKFKTNIEGMVDVQKRNIGQIGMEMVEIKNDVLLQLQKANASIIVHEKGLQDIEESQLALKNQIISLNEDFDSLKNQILNDRDMFQKLKIQYLNSQNIAKTGTMTFKQVKNDLQSFQKQLQSFQNAQRIGFERLQKIQSAIDFVSRRIKFFQKDVKIKYVDVQNALKQANRALEGLNRREKRMAYEIKNLKGVAANEIASNLKNQEINAKRFQQVGNRFKQFQNSNENELRKINQVSEQNRLLMAKITGSLNWIGNRVVENTYENKMASDGRYRYKIWNGQIKKPKFNPVIQ